MASDGVNKETISSAFVESAVNEVVSKRMAKRQQIHGASPPHLLLQTRTKVLNGDLDQTFRAWYLGFRQVDRAQEQKAAA